MVLILCLPTLVALSLWTSVYGQAARAPVPATVKADRGDQCGACHESVASHFKASAHGKAKQFISGAFEQGCESCHGDANEQMSAGGDKSKIINPGRLKGAEASKNCIRCHQTQRAQMHWKGSAQQKANVSCVDCHKTHGGSAEKSSLAGKTEPETCFRCHGNLRHTMFQRSAHPLRDGKMTCSSCHNPHGTMTGNKLLKANSTNDLCLKCHAEKRGPFLWEHAPSRENCLSCHASHGSNHDKLLTMTVTMTCQNCHNQGRHQSVAGRPNALFNIGRACLQCHPQVHGSNHPAGQLFQR
jgi:DmsE family decaheme c-type cytochrome